MIRKIINKIKVIYKTKIFNKNAHIGLNTCFGSLSNCFNEGGEITIGDFCDIHAIISCKQNAHLTIGSHTTIRGGSIVGAVENVEIGNNVIISNNVTIYDNNNHPTSPQKREEMCKSGFYSELWNWKYSEHKPVIIKDNVWIGEKAVILKGVTIGEGSIVGCNSVVTKNIPPYSIAVGNPAKVVKTIDYLGVQV